jgi:hypothetical protein
MCRKYKRSSICQKISGFTANERMQQGQVLSE